MHTQLKPISLAILICVVGLVGCGSGGAPQSPSAAVETPSEVVLRWTVPSERANGEHLDRDEMGGYEVRYRESPEYDFTSIFLEDGGVDELYMEANGDYEFQIAAYDINGLYSGFVELIPYE